MTIYFNSLFKIASFIENNKDLLNNVEEYLLDLDNNEKYTILSNNAYYMQKIISQLHDKIHNKFFFGFIENKTYKILWDSSSYNNNINENIQINNLVNPIDNINKIKNLNITNDILIIRETYLENENKNKFNPSIIYPIFNKEGNIKFFVFVHAWINKSELINGSIYNESVSKDILRYDNISNKTKEIIKNNSPIEDKLNVIIVLSNPCGFKKRVKLANDFILRMKFEKYVELYIVELAYDCNPVYYITEENNKNHLQLRTKTPLWHKENMINLGVQYLLPQDWKAFAWIDADIEFENESWALDTLKILNGEKNIVQLFSHAIDMAADRTALSIVSSAGYKYDKKDTYIPYKGANYWHPGYAWACTKEAYKNMNGLWQYNILGGGDHVMCINAIHFNLDIYISCFSDDYKEKIDFFQKTSKYLNFGYVPGIIRHNYHGSKENRKYIERIDVLIKYNYSPNLHVTFDSTGILIPTNNMCNDFKNDIYTYFVQRNEDEE
jgi:hypothetical protein